VWEFCKLIEKGLLAISCDAREWVRAALAMPKLRLVQLSPRIACSSIALPKPFSSDPADQIIVATAREENATLITKDETLRGYKHVRTLW
jgi:PIN domain nuclease of toxin-antitoxin system